MFGLGLLELAVIVGVVVLLFGATGAKKLLATAKSVRNAKRDLTTGAVFDRLTRDDSAAKPAKETRDEGDPVA